MRDSILEPLEQAGDEEDKTLRPKALNDFVGQKLAKESLALALKAAKNRHEPLDHVLLYGPPGLGKTTIAHIIANELGGSLHLTAGPAITRAGDLASLLMNLETNDVIFVDEIHRINRAVEETLYSAMEEGRLDIILGKGPAARSVSIDIKPFTLVGATTKYGSLTSPLRSRFGIIQKLGFYDSQEIERILTRSAEILKVTISKSAVQELAERSRGIPRIANRLLKRARDMAEINFNSEISSDSLASTFELLKIDHLGLDQADRDVLRLIIEHHSGGPVGLSTIASSLSEDEETILDVYEPFLMAKGLLARTKQGRVVTKLAYNHLGITEK
ncbi:MAG: Holliday junction ATP-dependent DNA helicase RuvB [Microgenomates group bacterium GW2011_GWF2_47_9]|nr:MAG: Holliday junction ATP-dependent DNA helicase RuvB [Microgenomates group bacterium GW2011_GWF2_47_9]